MKKLMRIALVFALAGATLVGCTKDYSGDISDLNKKVSEQATALSALQTQVGAAQTAADAAAQKAAEALAEAQKKATPADVQAAEERVNAKINDLVNGDVKALKEAVAALEGIKADERLTALETAIKDFVTKAELAQELAALKEELEATIAAGDKVNADAIAELTEKVNELLARPYGEFSVTALTEARKVSTYSFAKWNPGTTKSEQALFAKLVKEFPELAEIKKGTAIESFGALPFIVNPSSIVLDDTYTFSLVNKDGEDSGIELGNPTLGYAVKAGSNVWNVEVQSPAFDEYGKPVYDFVRELSLVVENAEGVSAQTAFDYTIRAYDAQKAPFALKANDVKNFVFDGSNNFDAFAEDKDGNAMFSFPWAPLYDNYFIIEADAADVEEFGIEINGSEISFNKVPVAGGNVEFTITAVGVNGTTMTNSAKLSFVGTIAPNAELAAKEVTLGYKNGSYKVAVDYAVADFGFSALEWKKVFEALTESGTVKAAGVENTLEFYKADGKTKVTADGKYSDAAIMRVYVNSRAALPGTYTITITDGAVFCGEGELTIKNPETSPVALIKALCKDGVLQIVGESNGEVITYDLNNALVFDENEVAVKPASFYDEDQTSSDEDNWVARDGKTVTIPANKALLYTERNFSVKYGWFTNLENEGTFSFKAQVVSPIYAEGGKDYVEVANQTIYLGGDNKTEFTAFEVSKIVKSAKYVAGDDINKPYNVFNTWVGTSKATYLKDYTAPYFSTDGYVLTGKNGKVKAFTRDQLFDLSIISADTWKDYNDDDIFYLHKSGWVKVANTIITYERGWSLNEAIEQWGTWVSYETDAAGNGKYVILPNNEHDVEINLGDWRRGPSHGSYGTYTVTVYGTQDQADAIKSHNFNFGSNPDGKDARKAKVDAYIESLKGTTVAGAKFTNTPANDLEPLNTFFACKDDIAAYPDSKNIKTPAGEAHITVPAASEISVVKIGFKNPVEADKFIDDVTEIDDAYLGSGSCTISVDPDAEFKAGLTSVDLPAYIKIADNWGMTMEIPFTVTVKVASK